MAYIVSRRATIADSLLTDGPRHVADWRQHAVLDFSSPNEIHELATVKEDMKR